MTQHSAVNEENAKADQEAFDLAEVLRKGREKQDQAGIKHKAVGVSWEDLEVVGAGGLKINIRNFSSAIIDQPRTILHKNSGLLKPGEMCLVLGRPNAGCSTFLKSIANQPDGFLEVNGNVEYAGVGWKEMAKLYAGEVVYNQEDDHHLPTLTVAQTIRFALSTKRPRKRISGLSDSQFKEEVLGRARRTWSAPIMSVRRWSDLA
ncbi:hypothetical protein JCM24511_08120 [Saitozyma sp. JCM 24511]|nr:hypothetical protein JCM24511_08120 [Saitozyma sp. JCM 24511]